jgi:hypothetical protein
MLLEIIGHLLYGERPAKPPGSMRLRDLPSIPMYEDGWILLGERVGHEIALGLGGKLWRPVIEFAPITSEDEFRDFDEPASRRRCTTCPCARSLWAGRCCPSRCGQPPPTSTRGLASALGRRS